MSSAAGPLPAPSPADTTTRARIRDAAVLCFGRDGARTTVRAVAAEAGVSAPLVLHHYGSKDGLRASCDEHVLGVLRAIKTRAMTDQTAADTVSELTRLERYRPYAAYLAHALTDGGDAGRHVFDGLVDDAEAELAAGVEAGRVRASAHPRDRALVVVTWALAPLLLAEHVGRHLGTDGYDADAMRRVAAPAVEILTHGVLADDALLEALHASAPDDEEEP